MPTPKTGWDEYEVRAGRDGKSGIYLRKFNIRLATFNSGTNHLQQRLQTLFDRAAAAPKRKPKRRRLPRNTGPFSGDVGDQGYRPMTMPTRP